MEVDIGDPKDDVTADDAGKTAKDEPLAPDDEYDDNNGNETSSGDGAESGMGLHSSTFQLNLSRV